MPTLRTAQREHCTLARLVNLSGDHGGACGHLDGTERHQNAQGRIWSHGIHKCFNTADDATMLEAIRMADHYRQSLGKTATPCSACEAHEDRATTFNRKAVLHNQKNVLTHGSSH